MEYDFELSAKAEISPDLIFVERFIVCCIEFTNINNGRSGTFFVPDMSYKWPGRYKTADNTAYEVKCNH